MRTVSKAVTHQKRRSLSLSPEEKRALTAEPYQSFLPWVCALWRWRCCCCAHDENTRDIPLEDHTQEFDRACAETGTKMLDGKQVHMLLRNMRMSVTHHECMIGVKQFGKKKYDFLTSEEFEKFFGKLTRRSYVGSKETWVRLAILVPALGSFSVQCRVDTNLLQDKPTENETINSFVSFCAASVYTRSIKRLVHWSRYAMAGACGC